MKKKLLVFVEYIFLGLSALGTILATVSGQVGFAVIPTTLTLLINLINRKSLTQLSLKTEKNEIIFLEDKIKYMEDRIDHLEKLLSITVERDEFEQKLHKISQTTARQTKSSRDEVVRYLKNLEGLIHRFENTLSLDRAETQTVTVHSSMPPKVESKYRKENFSHNPSANSRTENNSKSNTTPINLENEIERGIHEIGMGIQEIGESIFRNFRN